MIPVTWFIVNEEEAQSEISEPEKPTPPEVPPECHNTTEVDPERAMAATRAMCGDKRKGKA